MDLVGPARVCSAGGKWYVLVIVDDYSRYAWVFFLAEVAWWREKQDEVVDRSRCRVAAHDQSLHAGFVAVHQKIVGLLG
jgi:hypothetical protein